MGSQTSRTQPRRVPQQDRSVHRVKIILDAARALVEAEGASTLKMTDIARKAGIPIGSLYQYFPEKAAIIKALYDQLSADVSTKVQAAFASIDSLEDAVSRAESIVDWYFEEFTRNPLHIEIWLGVETDRELLHLNARESWQASEIFCNAVRPFLDRSKIDIEARALVLTHLTGAAVRLAVFQPNEDLARRILNEWKYVLRQTFFA